MAEYERVNWENTPSTDTPLDADNLNRMDYGISLINAELKSLTTQIEKLEEKAALLQSRITSIASIPEGGTSGDAEVIAARVGYDGTEYDSLGDAIVGQVEDLNERVEGLEESGAGISEDLKDALLQLASKVAYIDDDGQDYYDDLYDALYETTWGVTNTLSNCTSSNSAQSVTKNGSYAATISASAGYTLTGATVSITMGGTDITSSVYNNGSIYITSVTGALVISVTAAALTLSSISAVYTQGSVVVYPDTPLNDLKSGLVVTATYNDSSTATVPSTSYVLSGTLSSGTSTVTVTYNSKTTTFNVTVTAILYPFTVATHNFTSPAGTVEATNGNTAVITNSTANSNDIHANVSNVSANGTACNNTNNYTNGGNATFTIQAGTTVRAITKINSANCNTSVKASASLRDTSGTNVMTLLTDFYPSQAQPGDTYEATQIFESDTNIACIGVWFGQRGNKSAATMSASFVVYVGDVRYI